MDAIGFGDDGLESKVRGDRKPGREACEHLGVGGGEGMFGVEEDIDASESGGSELNMRTGVIRGGKNVLFPGIQIMIE